MFAKKGRGKPASVIAGAVLAATMGLGCAIHSQAPIKEIAYDFSDADFYDRAFAPSPDYGDGSGEGKLRAKVEPGVETKGKSQIVWLPAYVMEPGATLPAAAPAEPASE
ncbi:MAG: hypothetical protein HY744_31050 [Deltaproteobacteria bacterium]|nr:hypothetical protein [Deltaproteobacteria bacterium]